MSFTSPHEWGLQSDITLASVQDWYRKATARITWLTGLV
jgi:hypothetical protein